MQFCPECDNLLVFTETDGKLYKICRACNYRVESDDVIISYTTYKDSTTEYGTSKWAYLSPAVARTIHQECANPECPSRADRSLQEAIILKKGTTMQLMYMCAVCHTTWAFTV